MFSFSHLGSTAGTMLGGGSQVPQWWRRNSNINPSQPQGPVAPTMGFNPAYGMNMPMGQSREAQFNQGQQALANRPQFQYRSPQYGSAQQAQPGSQYSPEQIQRGVPGRYSYQPQQGMGQRYGGFDPYQRQYRGYNPGYGRSAAMGNIYGYDQSRRNRYAQTADQNRLNQMQFNQSVQAYGQPSQAQDFSQLVGKDRLGAVFNQAKRDGMLGGGGGNTAKRVASEVFLPGLSVGKKILGGLF